MVMIDTLGCDFYESVDEDDSKFNVGELSLVIQYVKRLLSIKVLPSSIAIISPYHAQVTLLRDHLLNDYPELEIHSVDGFQGREKDVVILSFVRCNSEGEIGFLSEFRRTNVAITRAKRHVCVVGDTNTLSRNKFLNNLIKYIDNNGLIYNAHDFIHCDDFELFDMPIEKEEEEENNNNKLHPFIHKENFNKQYYNSSNNKNKNDNIIPNPPKIKNEIKENILKEEKILKNEDEDEIKELDDKTIKESDDYQYFYKIVSSFYHGHKDSPTPISYSFPITLNSYQRLIIHSICEEFNIKSESNGEGKFRHITITCGNDNIIEKKEIEVIQPPPQNQEPKEKKYKPKNKKKKERKIEEKIEDKDENIDKILEDAQRGVSKCGIKDCKAKNVLLLGGTCKYCKMRYCFAHMQPELHGCGNSAKYIIII